MSGAGTFSQKLIFQLLELHKERRGGILRAESGTLKKQLVVRQGRLAFAESNAPEDHLARVMVSMNLLPKMSLSAIAAQMKERKTSDEAILAVCKVGYRELEEGAREQALQVLSSLLSWDSGEVRLYASEKIALRKYDLALPLPDLVVAAARRAAARRPIPQAFSPLPGLISPALENRENLLILPLDRTEGFAFSLVAGPSRVEEVVSYLTQEHAKPEEVILRLLILGLVQKGEGAPPAEEPEVQPRAPSELERRLDDMLQYTDSGDLYAILGVAPDAGDSEIKEAYHSLAKRYHPDRFQSNDSGPSLRSKAERLFASITGAYARLGNQASRSSYDRERKKQGKKGVPGSTGGAAGDLDRENMAEVMYRAGMGFYSKGDFEKAAEKLRECVWLKPGVARYRHLLGASQAAVPKMRKEAEQNLLKAIELDPTLTEAHVALGRLYLEVGMARRAEAQVKEALRLSPENESARSLLREIASSSAPQR